MKEERRGEEQEGIEIEREELPAWQKYKIRILKNVKEWKWRLIVTCFAEHRGKEGADCCQEKRLHLKSIFQKPKIMFQKVKNDMGTSCTSILSPSLVTRVQEVASLEIACRCRSLSTCESILIQISSTTDFPSPTIDNLSLSDG